MFFCEALESPMLAIAADGFEVSSCVFHSDLTGLASLRLNEKKNWHCLETIDDVHLQGAHLVSSNMLLSDIQAPRPLASRFRMLLCKHVLARFGSEAKSHLRIERKKNQLLLSCGNLVHVFPRPGIEQLHTKIFRCSMMQINCLPVVENLVAPMFLDDQSQALGRTSQADKSRSKTVSNTAITENS